MDRLTASSLGYKTYMPDKPCRKGHSRGRYVSTGACIECAANATKRWQKRFTNHPPIRYVVGHAHQLPALNTIASTYERHGMGALLELSPPDVACLPHGWLLITLAVPEPIAQELTDLMQQWSRR